MGAAPSTPAPTYAACPTNQSTYTSNTTSQIFQLSCNADFTAGTDLGQKAGSGLLDCTKQCDAITGCAAVVYEWTGNCQFRDASAQYVYQKGVQAAMLQRLYDEKPRQSSACPAIGMSSTTSSVTVTKTTLTTSASTTLSTKVTSVSSSQPNKVKVTTTSAKTSSAATTSHIITTTQSIKPRSPSTSTTSHSFVPPQLLRDHATQSPSQPSSADSPQLERRSEKSLTFLAMGDSITYGYLANESYNSYRLGMIDLLTATTPLWNTVQSKSSGLAMYQNVYAVGSIQSGNFTQNASEGFDGGDIPTIQANWLERYCTYTRTPDVATILAGIHDVSENTTDTKATWALSNLGGLIDALYTAYPNITVVVSTLTPTTVTGWQSGVAAYNKALPGIVNTRAKSGQKIVMVDGGAALNVTTDMADFVHPNAGGYRKLAQVFYQGLRTAQGKKWIP